MRKRYLLVLVPVLCVSAALITFIVISNHNKNQDDIDSQVNSEQGIESKYLVVDTGQELCFGNEEDIACPGEGEKFYGQDAQVEGLFFNYTNNDDGTVTDNNTLLMWQQSADLNGDGKINIEDKKNQKESEEYCNSLELSGYDDWRLPDIKTLYSLMAFSGRDPSGNLESKGTPFINTEYFDFGYGDTNADERSIDSQWATSTIYTSTVMNGEQAMFGLNLADGRIKGYPVSKKFYIKCVRGNTEYGVNNFVSNGDGTVTDIATGLEWQKNDSTQTMDWEEAFNYCNENKTAGRSDWRLPNIKELQSIVDYSRSPDATSSPAIDSIFHSTSFTNENNQKDWGYYWSSTTHARSNGSGSQAAYISFGRALGYMTPRQGQGEWMDVHGAGAQRSDPKVQLEVSDLPTDPGNPYKVVNGALTHGPQGDLLRSMNYVRCVRDM